MGEDWILGKSVCKESAVGKLVELRGCYGIARILHLVIVIDAEKVEINGMIFMECLVQLYLQLSGQGILGCVCDYIGFF